MPLTHPVASRPIVIASSGTAVSLTGTATETALASIAIPANLMGTNGRIIAKSNWSVTNSANNKTIRHKIGASGIGGTNIGQIVVTTIAGARYEIEYWNKNAANSQGIVWSSTGFGPITPVTAAIDTTAVHYMNFTAQLATTSETITLDSYQVLFFPAV